MDDSQRFFWIKIPVGFYSMPEIDWIREQKNGCEYIVFYQMLCHLAINTGGKLIRIVGEMAIPYDAKKIAEVTHFSIDTVMVALKLLEQVKLIFKESYGPWQIWRIANFHKYVGSETKGAERKRLQRENKKLKKGHLPGQADGQNGDTGWDNVPLCVPDEEEDNIPSFVPPEYRDKSLEFRGKNIDTSTLPSTENISSSSHKDSNSFKGNIPVDISVDNSVDNFRKAEEELHKRHFDKKSIIYFLREFTPELILRQLTNYDRSKADIQKNREGWFYTALQNDFAIPFQPRPDPHCLECRGTGQIERIVEIDNTKKIIKLPCPCLKKDH